jgi:hypothetical protein
MAQVVGYLPSKCEALSSSVNTTKKKDLKVVKGNIEKNVYFKIVGISSDCLNRIPVAQEITARIDKRNYIKLKSFYTAKTTIARVKNLENEKKSLPDIYLTGD